MADQPTNISADSHFQSADKKLSPLQIIRRLRGRINDHNVVVVTAGVAFYGVLALVPTLVATISIYGLVNQGNESNIRQQISDTAGSLDQNTQQFIETTLTDITTSSGKTTSLILSILAALFSASGGVQKLMNSVGQAYEADESRPGWKVRLMAYGLTVGAIVGVVLIVTVVGVAPALLDEFGLGSTVETVIRVLQLPVFALGYMAALTVLYRHSPDRPVRTPWRNPGAVVAAGLWVVLALGFSYYSSNIGAMPAAYGLLGTIAALMIFLQLTAFSIIIGAEYNAMVEEATWFNYQRSPASNPVMPNQAPVKPIGLAQAAVGLILLFLLGRTP